MDNFGPSLSQNFSIPVIKSPVQTFFENFIGIYEDEKRECSNDEQISVFCITPSGEIQVARIQYMKPDMIWIKGLDTNNNPVSIISHYSNCLIIARRELKISAKQPAFAIGFGSKGNEAEEKS